MRKRGLSFGHSYKNRKEEDPLGYAAVPQTAFISLKQHRGPVALPVVSVGQMVERGQLVARAVDPLSADVHAPAPGVVKAITVKKESNKGLVNSIEITTGGRYSANSYRKDITISYLSHEAILGAIKTAGLVEVGKSHPLPLASRLNLGDQIIDNFVINAMTDEPYSGLNESLLLNKANEIAKGVAIVAQLIKPTTITIAINSPLKNNALPLQALIHDEQLETTIYESDGTVASSIEHQLGEQISGHLLNFNHDLASSGTIILGLNSLIAIYRAIFYGESHIQHAISISGGAVAQKKVLMAYIGTPIGFLLDECGGYKKNKSRIIAGSALRGFNVIDEEAAITKEIEQIIVLNKAEVNSGLTTDCTMCNYCVKACPRQLWPHAIYKALMANRDDLADELNIERCIECGACSYICPSRLKLSQSFSLCHQKRKGELK